MTTDNQEASAARVVLAELSTSLIARYGELVSAKDLAELLAYRTPAAFRKARQRKRLPVPTFQIAARRGVFARTREVAVWLAALGVNATATDSAKEHLASSPPAETLLTNASQTGVHLAKGAHR